MKTRLIIAALLSATCLTAHGSTNSPVEHIQTLVRTGRFAEARQLVHDTVASNSVAAIRSDFMNFLGRPFVQAQQIETYIATHSVSNSPAYWVLKITQADAYWAWGKTNECIAIYESFMKEFPRLIGTNMVDGQHGVPPYRR
jgi:hypothetical protein